MPFFTFNERNPVSSTSVMSSMSQIFRIIYFVLQGLRENYKYRLMNERFIDGWCI